jgi:hypothetical protein
VEEGAPAEGAAKSAIASVKPSFAEMVSRREVKAPGNMMVGP